MGLGYRTFELTPYLHIHPSEAMAWGLFVVFLGQRIILGQKQGNMWLPSWIWLFIPFWVWGWWLGFQMEQPWDRMFAEFRNFLILIPLFVLAGGILPDKTKWPWVLLSFYATGAWVAGTGLIEYAFPSIRDVFPGFISNPIPISTPEGFLRASFSFWGSPAATFLCILTVPMALAIWQWWCKPWQRVLNSAAMVLQIMSIYIGGYRSIWLLLGLQVLIWVLIRYGVVMGILAFVPTLLTYRFFPGPTQERMVSLMLAVQRNPMDSSAAKRWDRFLEALEAALRRPWGHGWAAAGWVHSDFIQIAANLGVLAALILLGAYLMTLWSLGKEIRSDDVDQEGKTQALVFFIVLIAAGGLLAMQGVEVLPQLIIPVWFVWVLAEIWLRQTFPKKKI
jgi:hypothetical protein